MRLLPIRVALKTFSLEEWFWRLVFVVVVCDFLYLGWFIVRSATRTLTLKEGIANFKAGTEGGEEPWLEAPIACVTATKP